MQAITLKAVKDELKHLSQNEILELCVRLAKFKKENKELLGYLLFDANNEDDYVNNIKTDITQQFTQINKKTNYLIKKGVRKILTNTKKYIKYSNHKETEVALLIHFCEQLKNMHPPIKFNKRVQNMYNTQVKLIEKRISLLHEDLQFDYQKNMTTLKSFVRH